MPIATRISPRPRAFTLLETLIVVALIGILAALLLPVFFTARGRARQTVCASNLKQLGLAVELYKADFDGYFPRAVDPIDRATPTAWSGVPAFAADVAQIGLIQDVLKPYAATPELFHCPADTGFEAPDFAPISLPSFPSSYQSNGTSYFYRTELAATRAHDSEIKLPAQVNVLFDGVGFWHGTLVPLASRYNVLYADGHVKNLSAAQIYDAWDTPLR